MVKGTTEDDTYSYRGWLVSDHFLKRMLAVWFHNGVAYCIMMILFWFGITAVRVFNEGNYAG